jgi:hypothetical protein
MPIGEEPHGGDVVRQGKVNACSHGCLPQKIEPACAPKAALFSSCQPVAGFSLTSPSF